MRMTRSLLILATTSALAAPRRQSNQISSNYPLLNSHIVTLTGTGRTVGEAPNMPKRGNTQSQVCEFTISLAPNEWAKEVRGLPSTQPRFNPDGTCEGEFEVGTPPDSALPPQTVAGRARAARNLSSPYVVGVYCTARLTGELTTQTPSSFGSIQNSSISPGASTTAPLCARDSCRTLGAFRRRPRDGTRL